MASATKIVYNLSPALSKVLGASTSTRPAALKGIWDYIKKNSLKHPTQAKVITCDANLAAVFSNKSEVTQTEIMKYLSPNLIRI